MEDVCPGFGGRLTAERDAADFRWAVPFRVSPVSPDGKFTFARDLSGKGRLYPIAGGEPRPLPGWSSDDIWITCPGTGTPPTCITMKKHPHLCTDLISAQGKEGWWRR